MTEVPRKMLAAVLHGPGDLRVEEVAVPEPREGEALVRVEAAGLCGSDLARVFVTGAHSHPLIPGHEVAGEVVAGPVELVGRRAALYPLIPCGQCDGCRSGTPIVCTRYNYVGSRCDGGFAEYVKLPAGNLVPVPEGVAPESAALTEPAAVALHALGRAELCAGETVAVFGCGPVGLMAGSWARILGADRVIMVDILAARLAGAWAMGFRDALDGRANLTGAQIEEMTEGGTAVTVEASGSGAGLVQAILATKALGRLVLLGNPSGDVAIQKDVFWRILRRQLTVVGTWNSRGPGAGDDWQRTLAAMADGSLDVGPLISHVLPLEKINEALELLRDRPEETRKIVIVPGESE